MIEEGKAWFFSRSPREQYMLGTAGMLAVTMLVIFGLILPIYTAIGSAEKQLDIATQRRGNIEMSVAMAGSKSGAPAVTVAATSPGTSLEALIAASAASNGFELADGAAIGGDEYRFRLASTKAGALLAWLTGLEAQGIEVAQITVRNGQSGSVSAELRLRRKP